MGVEVSLSEQVAFEQRMEFVHDSDCVSPNHSS